MNRTKRTLQANVIEEDMKARPWQMDPEVEILRAEITRMRPVFRKVAYWVKVWKTDAASIDGVYPKEIVDVFRAYERCARAARKAKGKR